MACRAISVYGPTIKAHDAPGISHSRIRVSSGHLCDAFLHANIDNVAIFTYGMKELTYFDFLSNLLLSTDTEVCRRYDLGVNKILPEIPFFAISDRASQLLLGQGMQNVRRPGSRGWLSSISVLLSSPAHLGFLLCYCISEDPPPSQDASSWKKYIPAKISGKVINSKYFFLFTFLLLQVARGRLRSYQDFWMSWRKKWTRVTWLGIGWSLLSILI